MSSNLFDDDSSDEDEEAKSPVKKRVIEEDDDDDESEKAAAPKRIIDADDDDSDDDDDAPKKSSPKKKKGKDNASNDDAEGNNQYDPDEEDMEFDDKGGIVGSAAPAAKEAGPTEEERKAKQAKPTRMTVMETKRPDKETTMHITKLPNLVGIQSEPFDADTYSPELEEKEYNGYVHNMIRWRYKKDENGNFIRNNAGKLTRESNARIVKWEDGSMTLHVGQEVFSVDQINPMPKTGYPGLNGYLYLSQNATVPVDDNDDDHDGGGEEKPGGTVLECMGPISSKLMARPSSLQSEAHKALTVAVRQKTVKRARIAEYVTQEDPEKMKEDRIRQKTDLDKAVARKGSSARSGGGGYARKPGMNKQYFEDRHYDSVNIKDLKKRRFGDDDEMDYGDDDSDEEEEDVGWTKGKLAAMRNRKRRAAESDEEEEFGAAGDDDSDDEEQEAPHIANKSTKKRQALFDDDDD